MCGEKPSEELSWYAIYAKHHHEKKIAELLSLKGTEVFLPLFISVRRWKDRKQKVAEPLFPGYVFVRSDLRDRVSILSTPGVFFLVENAGRACAIPDAEVDAIRRVVGSERSFEPHPYLQAGERIRVLDGPLAGISGFFVRLKKQDRIVVSIELLRKSVSVEVDLANVEKISEENRALAAGSYAE
jgi:transcription antitermination factor NusG